MYFRKCCHHCSTVLYLLWFDVSWWGIMFQLLCEAEQCMPVSASNIPSPEKNSAKSWGILTGESLTKESYFICWQRIYIDTLVMLVKLVQQTKFYVCQLLRISIFWWLVSRASLLFTFSYLELDPLIIPRGPAKHFHDLHINDWHWTLQIYRELIEWMNEVNVLWIKSV